MHRLWDIIIKPVFDEVKPKNIVEIGSDKGINTINILKYCKENNAKLTSIDPSHKLNLKKINEEYANHFELIEDFSLNVLPSLKNYDMILIDGDHNWYTVFNELKTIEKQFENQHFPFIILHDVSWPYGRRDMYYNPDSIPKKFKHEYKKLGIYPDSNKLLEHGGLNADLYNAIEEDLPRNGVRTAIEDFIKESNLRLTLHIINAFHGLGLLYYSNNHLDKKMLSIINNSNIEEYLEIDFFKKLLNVQNALEINNIEKKKLSNQINELNNNINSYEKQVENLSKNLKEQENINNSLNQEINDITSDKNKFIKNIIANDEVIATQQKVISEQSKIITDLQKQIDEISSENTNLKNINKTANDKIQKNKEEIENLNEEINSLSSKINSLNKELDSVNEEYQNDIKNYSMINQDMSLEINEIKRILEEKKLFINKQDEKLVKIDGKLADLEETYDILDAENKKLSFINNTLSKTNDVHLNIIDNQTKKINNYEKLLNKTYDLFELIKLYNKNDENINIKSLMDDYQEYYDNYETDSSTVEESIYYKIKKENELLKNENDKLKTFKNDVLTSNSWKITGLLRNFRS